ncbi:MAG: hypothetical protein GX140_09770 [Bacteroidales bacterium]|jgi:hypothetical protein|nr:hypothetical protein [Bacteroidales bacterium]
MKKIIFIIFTTLIISGLYAQNEYELVENIREKKEFKIDDVIIGLSAKFNTNLVFDANNTIISVPVIIKSKVKLEPEIGYCSNKTTLSDNSFYNESNIVVGASIGYIKQYDRGLFNIGIRGGFASRLEAYASDSKKGFYLGPVVGYDFFFSKNFAIGVDINPYFFKMDDFSIFRTGTAIKASFFL